MRTTATLFAKSSRTAARKGAPTARGGRLAPVWGLARGVEEAQQRTVVLAHPEFEHGSDLRELGRYLLALPGHFVHLAMCGGTRLLRLPAGPRDHVPGLPAGPLRPRASPPP